MTEHVALPEPGASLLRQTWPTLQEWLRRASGEPTFVIGGGTMLAARWGHRASKDLDIRVQETNGSGLVVQMAFDAELERRFDRAMKRAGARQRTRLSTRQTIYVFGDPSDEGTPRVDLSEIPATLDTNPVWTQMGPMSFWAAPNAEILAAKWKARRGALLTRDVYDIATAGLLDGRALQRALTTDGHEQQLDEMVASLEAARQTLAREAKATLSAVPQELEHIREDPARWAAFAIGQWAVTRVAIRSKAGTWTVSTSCKAAPEGIDWAEEDTAEAAASRAQALTALPRAVTEEMVEDAAAGGEAEREGPGTRMSACTHAQMQVDAQGRVLMRDFGEAATQAPTIEEAIDIAIERGWQEREDAQRNTETLRALQRKAITREKEQSPQ